MRLIVCSIQVHERPISARPPPKRSYRFRPYVDVGVAPISVAQPEQFILESGHTHRRLPQGVMGGEAVLPTWSRVGLARLDLRRSGCARPKLGDGTVPKLRKSPFAPPDAAMLW
jgi:hypothetical protein